MPDNNFIILAIGLKLLYLLHFMLHKVSCARHATLLVASKLDPASMNIANSLINKKYFIKECEDLLDIGLYAASNNKQTKLWIQEEPLLRLDYVDVRCEEKFQLPSNYFEEIIFLSKHFSAVGKTALTVHPIGIPWQTENSRSGGIPGKCSPPSHRIAPLYRSMYEELKRREMSIDISLEVTHHGPIANLPVCFVEIGSTEADWGVPSSGEIWAEVLARNLLIIPSDFDENSDNELSSGVVVVSLGGGHYVPRINDAARLGKRLFVGHCLATYALEGHLTGELPEQVSGGWKGIIEECIQSTRLSFTENTALICLVDKKAFKASHRAEITQYLDELGVKWTYSFTDIKNFYSSIINAT